MKKVMPLIPAAFLVLLLSGAASAGRVVGLEEAVSLALKGNPALRALGRSVEAEREGIGVARSRLLPRVSFEERYLRTNNPTLAFSSKLNQQRFEQSDFMLDRLNEPDDIGDFQTAVSIEQLVYSRRAHVGLDMAKTAAGAASLDHGRKKEAVALEVVRAYMNVRTAKEFLRAAEKGVEEAREHRRIAGARFDAGLGLYSDTLRTTVFEKEAEERLVKARKALSVAMRALGLAMGLDEPVDIAGDEECRLPRELEYYLDAAMHRHDLGAMRMRAENARNGIKLATSGYLPTLGLGGSYQLNDPGGPFGADGDSYQVMAFLRWNVFDGALRKHERAQAKFRAEEALERVEGLRKAVRFRVHEAYLTVQEARQSLELARSREELAEESRRLVAERYENSLATVVELLDAQASLDDARADVARRSSEYLTSVAELTFQSGLILTEYIRTGQTGRQQ